MEGEAAAICQQVGHCAEIPYVNWGTYKLRRGCLLVTVKARSTKHKSSRRV